MWMMLKKHYAALYVGGQHPSAALLQKKPIDTFSECSDCGKEPALYPMKKTLQQTQLNWFFFFFVCFYHTDEGKTDRCSYKTMFTFHLVRGESITKG